MSAYMVSDEVINKIVAWLGCQALGNSYNPFEVDGYDLARQINCQFLARDMFTLNIQGVNARYGEGEAEKFRPLDFKYVPRVPSNRFSVIRALENWQYQCAEGDVPESDLYKAMSKVLRAMYRHVVQSLPEYEREPLP